MIIFKISSAIGTIILRKLENIEYDMYVSRYKPQGLE